VSSVAMLELGSTPVVVMNRLRRISLATSVRLNSTWIHRLAFLIISDRFSVLCIMVSGWVVRILLVYPAFHNVVGGVTALVSPP
jgi:hypothetical protein